MNLTHVFPIILLGSIVPLKAATQPPSIEESAAVPFRYVGTESTDKRFFDGGLQHAVGVHRYQTHRANRTSPPEIGQVGWTYNHQPYLAYWNNQFYLQFLSNLKEEHVPPGRTLLQTSKDGRRWTPPEVVFPEYSLPEIRRGDVYLPEGTLSVMHQRMGFYTAPNGRLLTLAFYSYCPTARNGPNNGQGLGRVVREVYKDGSFGPIYFIRYNHHAGWNESNTRFPFYETSGDSGFIEACEALLSDKLMTHQWWEEDRSDDGFYTFVLEEDMQPKAMSYFHRPDGVVLAVWKGALSGLSADEGQTWTPLVQGTGFMPSNSKMWIQRTDDDQYALVYTHSASRRNRFPMAVLTSEDGRTFDRMLSLHGEVSPMRYQGLHKNIGPQYIRGIAEGNGNPPGDHIWNTYSMNKEDMWVTRTQLPIEGTVGAHVEEDFESARTEADLTLWNLHIPQWAPVSVIDDPLEAGNRVLELRDEDPYEYALVERAFPEDSMITVEFRVLMRQPGHGILDFEVHDRHGNRPMRMRFDPEWLSMDRGGADPLPVAMQRGVWYGIKVRLDCEEGEYDLAINGQWVRRGMEFEGEVETLEKLVFRTGPWRGDVRPLILDGEPNTLGLYQEDLPGGDAKVGLSVYWIDDVKTGN